MYHFAWSPCLSDLGYSVLTQALLLLRHPSISLPHSDSFKTDRSFGADRMNLVWASWIWPGDSCREPFSRQKIKKKHNNISVCSWRWYASWHISPLSRWGGVVVLLQILIQYKILWSREAESYRGSRDSICAETRVACVISRYTRVRCWCQLSLFLVWALAIVCPNLVPKHVIGCAMICQIGLKSEFSALKGQFLRFLPPLLVLILHLQVTRVWPLRTLC